VSDHVSAALVVLAAIAMAVFALRRKREDTLQALGDAAADILREEARHIARRTLLRYGLGGVALVALGSWGWGSLQADMSPRTTTTWYNDATDTPSGLGAPDPTQLPTMLTGNPIDPVWAQFVDHALGSKAAGYSYTDTTSGALVTKLTDDTLPYSGGLGFGSMYSDGGTYISHPWGDNGDMFTIAIWQGDDTRTWLVDYQIGGTVSNYREAHRIFRYVGLAQALRYSGRFHRGKRHELPAYADQPTGLALAQLLGVGQRICMAHDQRRGLLEPVHECHRYNRLHVERTAHGAQRTIRRLRAAERLPHVQLSDLGHRAGHVVRCSQQ